MKAPSEPALVLWHHPDCALTRDVQALLEELGLPLEIVPLVEQPPSVDALRDVLARVTAETGRPLCDLAPAEAVSAHGLEGADDEALLAAMAHHVELIPRPLVFNGEAVRLADPMERALEVLIPAAPEDAGAAIRQLLRGGGGATSLG